MKKKKTDRSDHNEQTRHAYRKPLVCASFSSCSSSDTRRLHLFRHCRIPKLLSVQVHHGDVSAMLYFTLTKFMQVRLPMRVFFQIFSDVLRQQNVSGIAAVHDPLCRVDSSASHIRFSGCVEDPTDRSTMYAHPQLQFRILLECAAYFQRAFRWRFWIIIENQRDAVASGDCEQAPGLFRGLEFIRASDNLV